MLLPKFVNKPYIPPLSIQGTKTRILHWLLQNIYWKGHGTYYEPFLGSASVVLNIQPKKAILNDNNPHIIQFYRDIQQNKFTLLALKQYLLDCKQVLEKKGSDFYYEIRDQFNTSPSSFGLLFLNLTCWRNLMRFNAKGEFNAPFYQIKQSKKLSDQNRYLLNFNDVKGLYIIHYIERIKYFQQIIQSHDYIFSNEDFESILEMATDNNDFCYCDPPYILRNTQYYGNFTEKQFNSLIEWSRTTKCNFAISNWYSDKNNINPYITHFNHCHIKQTPFHYQIGIGKKHARNYSDLSVNECLILSSNAYYQNNLSVNKNTLNFLLKKNNI
jgi:DNA adenine methylase